MGGRSVTPFILLNNITRYLLALRLPSPGIAAMNTPIGSTAPSVGSGSFTFKLIYGAIVCVIGLGIAAYYNVAFVERHAPAINAKLHNGDISDESDTEYSLTKLTEDVAALVADTKSKNWAGYRSEMLSRAPYLLDLDAQNDKFQRRVAAERDANLGANDICEKLALVELGPALNDYTTVLNDMFSIVKNTTAPTPATAASLDTLSGREDAALRHLKAYFSDVKNHSCDK